PVPPTSAPSAPAPVPASPPAARRGPPPFPTRRSSDLGARVISTTALVSTPVSRRQRLHVTCSDCRRLRRRTRRGLSSGLSPSCTVRCERSRKSSFTSLLCRESGLAESLLFALPKLVQRPLITGPVHEAVNVELACPEQLAARRAKRLVLHGRGLLAKPFAVAHRLRNLAV